MLTILFLTLITIALVLGCSFVYLELKKEIQKEKDLELKKKPVAAKKAVAKKAVAKPVAKKAVAKKPAVKVASKKK